MSRQGIILENKNTYANTNEKYMASSKNTNSIRSITTLKNNNSDYKSNQRIGGQLVINHEEWSGTDNSNRKFFQNFNENTVISKQNGLRNDINSKLIYSYPPSNVVHMKDRQIRISFQGREKRFPIILKGLFH